MQKLLLNTAIASVLGAGSMVMPAAHAGVTTYSWGGLFTMLDTDGILLENASKPNGKNGNNFQTPVTGTLSYDDITGAGTATVAPFGLLNGSVPTEASFNLQAVGNGTGGPGSLVVGNMLFNWGGTSGIPASFVLDAAGLFQASNADFADGTLTQSEVAATGAIPSVDGSYVNSTFGYISTGPVILATTSFNTSNINGCTASGCNGNGASGGLPLLTDTATNRAKAPFTGPGSGGTGIGIGGSPMQDGPFQDSNINIDVTLLKMSAYDGAAVIAENCAFDSAVSCDVISSVPVPAAVWLFGSGILGLVGMARRIKPHKP